MKTIILYIINSNHHKISLLFNPLFAVFFMLFFAAIFAVDANAQTQSIEITTESVPADNTGPATTLEIPLFHNTDNPTGTDFNPFYPELTATISFGNFQYSVSQATGTGNPPVVLGWRFNPEGELADGISLGEDEEMVVPFTSLNESIDLDENEYSIAQMESFYSSTEPTIGAGIDFTANRGAFIAASFEGLGENELTPYESGARYHIADMTIEFNRPVTNPILHFFGLGGVWQYDSEEPDNNFYINAGTVEFDLETEGITLEVLSANPGGENEEFGLDIVESNGTSSIINTWNIPEVIDTEFSEEDDNGVANGSIIARGENIETITLRMYARAINDIAAARLAFGADGNLVCAVEDDCYIGDSGFGWNGGATGEGGDEIPEYNIAHDLFILSLSKEVQPDETLLTEGESFRMLSSPVANTSYRELLGNLWVQGPDVVGANAEFGDPNIFTWPLGVANSWNSEIDLNEPIPAGHGFLVTVFEDDVFGEEGEFPKTLSVTGSEHEPPITVESSDGDDDGWMLLGNPFKDPIDIAYLLNQKTTNTGGVIYIWDRGTEAEPDKGYRATTIGPDPEGPTIGDIDSGVLMPFQGFFIQKTDTPASVTFDDDPDLRTDTEGTFYRKERAPANIVRFELSGESLSNSMWLTFSENSSMDRLRNDALELMPLSQDYGLLGTRKPDGVLLTIGHFPIPDDEFEIPVSVETTKTGTFTIRTTDFNLALTHDLYFTDTQENKSIRIDSNFEYSFSVNQVAKINPSPVATLKNGPQKAVTELSDRFTISTQPKDFDSQMPEEVALSQNYPNPFNPTTQISYELPQQSDVQLVVFDMIGREVATLVNETVQAGIHNVNFDAANLSSGVYIYRLQAGSTVLSRKLTVIK
jgi:hypothetical protein